MSLRPKAVVLTPMDADKGVFKLATLPSITRSVTIDEARYDLTLVIAECLSCAQVAQTGPLKTP